MQIQLFSFTIKNMDKRFYGTILLKRGDATKHEVITIDECTLRIYKVILEPGENHGRASFVLPSFENAILHGKMTECMLIMRPSTL